jgi:hypothetical protein
MGLRGFTPRGQRFDSALDHVEQEASAQGEMPAGPSGFLFMALLSNGWLA